MPNRVKSLIETICHGDSVNTPHCAQFNNAGLKEAGYKVYDDAWKPQNAKMVFNGYDGLERPKKFVLANVEKHNDDASNNVLRKFNSAVLDTTGLYSANMYYRGSKFQEKAFNEGQGVTGTHTGALRWRNTTPDRKGGWELVHNIDNKIHVEPFTQIQGANRKWGVTAVYEPQKANWLDKAVDRAKSYIDSDRFELKTLREGGTLSFLVPMINNYKTNTNNGR